MGASPSTFRIADQKLVHCEAGSLDVEATLFAATAGTRATSTVAAARARLARSGLTAALATQAVEAIDPEALRSYARAECVRSVLSKLGPSEVFAGVSYDRATQSYDGSWIDLRSLAADLRVRSAGLVLQGLYLVSILDGLAPETPISLENGGGGEAARMAFLKPRSVIDALGLLGPRTTRAPSGDEKDDDGLVRAELARLLRDRSATGATAAARARAFLIEQALVEPDRPTSGPLASPDLWAIERQLAVKDLRGALERIQAFVRSHGSEGAGTRYLRAHLALLEGSEPPRRIAEDLLDEGRAGGPFHELELLKARAWMAAGGWTYARHFARGLINDPNVPDAVSLGAYEIFEASKARGIQTGPTMSATRPPVEPVQQAPVDVTPKDVTPKELSTRDLSIGSVTAAPIYMLMGETVIEPVPSSLELPIDFDEPSSDRLHSAGATSPRIVAEDPTEVVPPPQAWSHHYEIHRNDVHVAPPVFSSPLPRDPRVPFDRGHVTEPPPPMQVVDAIVVRAQPQPRYVAEDVESLSFPEGLSDRQLAEGVAARNSTEVRIVSTRFARLLAKEYREKYNVRLRTDAQAVEWMQRHLVMRWGENGLSGPEAAWDVRRHGALLSEILARTLGADWVDVAPSEIGYWAMFVPPRTRTWPFGRVYRFLTLGHREKDLVSYYLDLVSRARHG